MLLVLAIAFGIAVLALLARLRSLNERLLEQDQAIAGLTRRVWALESRSAHPVPAVRETPPVPALQPEPVPVEIPDAVPRMVPPEAASAEPEPSVPAFSEPAPVPPREDWESRIGANWLNRLGAAILVIGFALFLGYSLTHLGPGGKILIGVAAGVALLLAGVALEPSALYRVYSYSLMGAGWAVTFFTAYAAHGVPESRVVESPSAGAALLIAVTAGMVGHSLRYRSEPATAFAYLLGFIGLNVSPLTQTSVGATALLALSLIGLAWRFSWAWLPLVGVVLTYLTFILRYDVSVYGPTGFFNGMATLWVYWTAFEAYDLLTLRSVTGVRALFALNACGFTGAAILHQWNMKASDWGVFLGAAALAYLISAVLRTRIAASKEEGGYEWAATASTVLAAGALIERFSGVGITAALLVEGQMVGTVGTMLGSRWLQRLGAGVLGLACLKLVAIDSTHSGPVRAWTPTGALAVALMACNRWFVPGGWYFSVVAAAIGMLVTSAELPTHSVAAAWALAGVLLVAVGSAELPWIGVGVVAYACGHTAVVDLGSSVPAVVVCIAAAYAAQLLWTRDQPWVRRGLCAVGTALLTALLTERAEGKLLTVWFGAEAAALLVAGFALRERPFRLGGLMVFVLAIAKLFLYDLRELDTVSRILSFLILGVVLMAASWVYTRYRDKLRDLL